MQNTPGKLNEGRIKQLICNQWSLSRKTFASFAVNRECFRNSLSFNTQMRKNIITISCCLCFFSNSFAQENQGISNFLENPAEQVALTGLSNQEASINAAQNEVFMKLQHLKVTGFLQTQYQWGEADASLSVGAPNEKPDDSYSRIGIRRGHLIIAYEEGIASGVFRLDLTDKGIGIKDVYMNIKDPRKKTIALKAGIFNRPFGNEISYSSSSLESLERSSITQTLFPQERDMGVAIVYQPVNTSMFHFLKLEAGLFAGNGIKQETDSRKDFIGHLSANKKLKDIEFGGGVSYYYGSVFQGSENVFRMKDDAFILDNSMDNKGKFANRKYIGFDGQFSVKTGIGTTQLRAEYLFGEQPGSESGSKSPNESSLPVHDTYLRNFSGGYVIFVQGLGRLPLYAVLKYDWYDPNTKVSGNQIGRNNTTKSDILRNTFGFGMFWNLNTNLRLQAYYEINSNEKSESLAGYNDDIKDNIFTLRMQYKF